MGKKSKKGQPKKDICPYGGIESYTDEFGRMFCTPHNRDYCHICCVDYRPGNRTMEEAAGLRKEETPVEEAARMYAVSLSALHGMERMVPRPTEETFEQNRQFRDEYRAKLDGYVEDGTAGYEEVETAIRRAVDKERSGDIEFEAMTQAMSRLNPGQTEFTLGGEESQKIYDEYISGPTQKENRGDFFTCSFCSKTSKKKLMVCARCKLVSYCSKECQKAAWPAHKKNGCVKADKKPEKMKLTWDQVEVHGGLPAPGTLEVKAIKDESMMRQVFQCKDRVGMCRRIAVYTNSREIPGLRVGATLRWKKPKFHYFLDGSSGARIEEEDLDNIKVR